MIARQDLPSISAVSQFNSKHISIFAMLIVGIACFCACTYGVAKEHITITYGADYKPFAWGEGNVSYGVQKDFVDEILAKRLGLQVRHEVCPWARCQEYVKRGIRDGFFTVPTPARAEYTIASEIPFYQTRFVMHTGKNNPNIEKLKAVTKLSDLEGLTNLRHIHMLGSGWHENALKNMADVGQIRDASTIPIMLANLRADVYIEQSEMFRYQAKLQGVSESVITFEEPAIRTLGWHLFVGKTSKQLKVMKSVDRLLAELNESGELEKIKQRIFLDHGIE